MLELDVNIADLVLKFREARKAEKFSLNEFNKATERRRELENTLHLRQEEANSLARALIEAAQPKENGE